MQNQQPLGEVVAYGEICPLRWEPRAALPDPVETASLALGNAEVLRTLLGLDEHHADLPEEPPAVAHELQRLEFKINLVLDLVGQVLAHQMSLPPSVPVRLSATHLYWTSASPLAVGSPGIAEVYLSSRYPRALRLSGTVEAVEQGHVRVVLADLGEVVQELLEKLIFRHHRRQIAQARRTP